VLQDRAFFNSVVLSPEPSTGKPPREPTICLLCGARVCAATTPAIGTPGQLSRGACTEVGVTIDTLWFLWFFFFFCGGGGGGGAAVVGLVVRSVGLIGQMGMRVHA
jgi:hypothetical protein